MICSHCNKENLATARYCLHCGNPLGAAAATSAAPAAREPAKTSGKAIGSLIAGLVFFLWPIAQIVAIVLGHLAQRDIRRSGGRLEGGGMSLAGLILGYAGLVLMLPFILIIAAIAIPNLLRSRIAANEASAVGSLRTYNTALVTYQAAYDRGFPPSLTHLGPVAPGAQPTENAADLVDALLASGQKTGYRFTYQAFDRDADGKLDAYTLNADPVTPNRTGMRFFYTDESGVIRFDRERASGRSPPIQ